MAEASPNNFNAVHRMGWVQHSLMLSSSHTI